MGLKSYRLWVMGQLDSNVQSPTVVPVPPGTYPSRRLRGVERSAGVNTVSSGGSYTSPSPRDSGDILAGVEKELEGAGGAVGGRTRDRRRCPGVAAGVDKDSAEGPAMPAAAATMLDLPVRAEAGAAILWGNSLWPILGRADADLLFPPFFPRFSPPGVEPTTAASASAAVSSASPVVIAVSPGAGPATPYVNAPVLARAERTLRCCLPPSFPAWAGAVGGLPGLAAAAAAGAALAGAALLLPFPRVVTFLAEFLRSKCITQCGSSSKGEATAAARSADPALAMQLLPGVNLDAWGGAAIVIVVVVPSSEISPRLMVPPPMVPEDAGLIIAIAGGAGDGG
jgi:hypothetical protein